MGSAVASSLLSFARLVWLTACLSFACRAHAPEPSDDKAPLEYLEWTTQNAPADRALPLLVVIHGLGDVPERIAALFKGLSPAVRIIAPRAPDPWDPNTSWYPVDDPQRKSAGIRARAKLIAKLIEYVHKHRPTRGKAVVTGFSQGGALSFALAAEHGELLRGAVPIAGYLPPDYPFPSRIATPVPLLAFHGLEDQRVPYAEAERTVSSLRKAGLKTATLTGFARVPHAISDEMHEQVQAVLSEMLATSAARL